MTTEETIAKYFINRFYQPLGFLHCQVSSNEMWQHAKMCATLCVDEIINAIGSFGYTGTWYTHEATGKMTLNTDEDPATFWQSVNEKIKEL